MRLLTPTPLIRLTSVLVDHFSPLANGFEAQFVQYPADVVLSISKTRYSDNETINVFYKTRDVTMRFGFNSNAGVDTLAKVYFRNFVEKFKEDVRQLGKDHEGIYHSRFDWNFQTMEWDNWEPPRYELMCKVELNTDPYWDVIKSDFYGDLPQEDADILHDLYRSE